MIYVGLLFQLNIECGEWDGMEISNEFGEIFASCVSDGNEQIVSFNLETYDLKSLITYTNTCYNFGYDPINKVFLCPEIQTGTISYYTMPEVGNTCFLIKNI